MRVTTLMTVAMVGLVAVPASAATRSRQEADSLQARVWLDRGEEPVVEVGDEVRVYYRTSQDAYSAIFRIDTDGKIHLVFPQHPDADHFVGGGRDYRLLFPDSPRWRVREDPGAGYFFMLASPEPLDFSAFGWDADEGWDLSYVGEAVYEDPYVAIDDYVAVVMRDWEILPYGLDFLQYSVGATHTYPRFLCYDCHDSRSYSSWNPYDYSCTSYRVVIWDDPYFYPRYRYYGPNIVVPRALGPRPRYTVAARVGPGWGPIVRTRPAPPRRIAAYKEPARAPVYTPRNPRRRPSRAIPSTNPSTRSRAPGAVVNPSTRGSRPTAGGAADRRARPSLERRPTASTPSRRGVTAVPSNPRSNTGVARTPPRPPSTSARPSSRNRPGATPSRTPARVVPSPGASSRGSARRPAGRSTGRAVAPGAARARPTAPRTSGVRAPTARGSRSPGRVTRPPPTRGSSGAARGARPSGSRPTGKPSRPPRRPPRRPGG